MEEDEKLVQIQSPVNFRGLRLLSMSKSDEVANLDMLKFFPEGTLATFRDIDDTDEVVRPEFIQLNVGGTSFRLAIPTIQKRGEIGLLNRFVGLPHEKRLRLCDDYLEKTKEYFFQRSANLFDIIYHYYITGLCNRPTCLSTNIIVSELAYWGLTKIFYPEIGTADNHGITRSKIATTGDKFQYVRFGNIRRKIWNLCEVPESSNAARVFALTSIIAVFISNFGLVLGSLPQFQVETSRIKRNYTTHVTYYMEPHPILDYIEVGCIVFFSIEYLMKMTVAHNRRQVFIKFMNLIDLIAILPFYLELTLTLAGLNTSELADFQGALLVVRILRVLRVIRLFKLGRYSTGLQMFVKVIQKSIAQLGMVMAVVAIGIMFFSTLVYFTEKDQEGTKFVSIPATFWWCIVTVTTVGYGDMFPETTSGKLVASCAIACGVLVLSLPITVIVDTFMQVQEEFKQTKLAQSPQKVSMHAENEKE